VRKYPERPVLGVGAVVVDQDRVVLVKRAHEPLKGEWSLPGGAVEVGETVEAAVAREVREETGIEVRVGSLVEVLDRLHRGDDGRLEYHFVLLDYVCFPVGGSLRHSSDAADARWVQAAQLPEYGLRPEAMRVITKALESARATPAPTADLH